MLGIDLPGKGCGGRIRERLEDFQVEELLPYEFSGTGHTILLVEKRGLSTLRAKQELARHFRVQSRDVGYAGLKDSRAVTRQYFSLPGEPEGVKQFQHEWMKILETFQHSRKVKIGKLYANRFRIVIRGCQAEVGKGIFDSLQSVPNVYGWQRFGGRAGCTHRIGEFLVKGRTEEAEQLIGRSLRRVDKGLKWLYVGAYQAKIFNDILNERMKSGLDLIEGDLVKHFHGLDCSSSLFPGQKTPLAEGKQGEIERAVLKGEGVTLEQFPTEGKRRANLLPLWDKKSTVQDKSTLELEFTIPKGCFATAVLRVVMGENVE